MPGLVPGIHVFDEHRRKKTWMAGTSPAMTRVFFVNAMFTTFMRVRFTNVFECPRELQPILACGARASRVNSLAT
jgi:hypothetical protein